PPVKSSFSPDPGGAHGVQEDGQLQSHQLHQLHLPPHHSQAWIALSTSSSVGGKPTAPSGPGRGLREPKPAASSNFPQRNAQ
uniref:Uncharacterized protein n=1 Tax=Nothoprocta perdicaria TaxID=30464 RepID=A0A8C6YTS1_NOTPE